LFGTEFVGFGMGLAVGDVVGGDEVVREGDAGHVQPGLGEARRSGGNDGPGGWRKVCEECDGAGEGGSTGGVFCVEVFEATELGVGIEVGAKGADGVDGATAMCGVEGEGAFHAVKLGPAEPAAFVGRG